MYTIPSWLQIWTQDTQIVDFLVKLDFVVTSFRTLRIIELIFCLQAYSGGPLPTKVGNELLAAGVRVIPLYGGTEFGTPVSFRKYTGDVKDWEYVFFSPLVKTRWDDWVSVFTCCLMLMLMLMRVHEQTCDTHHLAVENMSDVKGYATSDLWVRHPTKPDLWKM